MTAIDVAPVEVPVATPVRLAKGPRRLSFSQATMFEQCPSKWRWRYVRNVRDEPGPEAQIGTHVHTVLEHLCLLPPEERTAKAAYRIAREHWEASDSLRRPAWEAVTRALWMPEVTGPKVLATEVPFDVNLDGVPFMGVIDRVEEEAKGIAVGDYKAGKRSTYTKSKAEKKKQVLLYAAAYPHTEVGDGTLPRSASLIWTATGLVDRYPVTDKSLAKAVGWLRGVWDRMQTARVTGQFAVNPGPLCSWCPAVARCPAGLDAVARRARDPEKRIGAPGQQALAAGLGEGLEVPTDFETEAEWERRSGG